MELKSQHNIYGEVTSVFIKLIGPIYQVSRRLTRTPREMYPLWTTNYGCFDIVDADGNKIGDVTFDKRDGNYPVTFEIIVITNLSGSPGQGFLVLGLVEE